MNNPGYIYILANPSMEGLVKIGKTTREPSSRVSELSSPTGVPTPFQLVYYSNFDDCDAAEQHLHTFLEEKGWKLAENREFFLMTTHDAINALLSVKHRFPHDLQTATPNQAMQAPPDHLDDADSIINSLLLEAGSYALGQGDKLIDLEEAIRLYLKAAQLGSIEACETLALIYELSENEMHDSKKSIHWYKEAIKKGAVENYSSLAQVYLEISDNRNAEKCWHLYLDSHTFRKNPSGPIASLCFSNVLHHDLDKVLISKLIEFKNEILSYVEKQIEEDKKQVNSSLHREEKNAIEYLLFNRELANKLFGSVESFDNSEGTGNIRHASGKGFRFFRTNIIQGTRNPVVGQIGYFQVRNDPLFTDHAANIIFN